LGGRPRPLTAITAGQAAQSGLCTGPGAAPPIKGPRRSVEQRLAYVTETAFRLITAAREIPTLDTLVGLVTPTKATEMRSDLDRGIRGLKDQRLGTALSADPGQSGYSGCRSWR
jgi:hypothetical protein